MFSAILDLRIRTFWPKNGPVPGRSVNGYGDAHESHRTDRREDGRRSPASVPACRGLGGSSGTVAVDRSAHGDRGRYPVISAGDVQIVIREPAEVHLFRPGSNSARPDEILLGGYSTVVEDLSGTGCGCTLRSKDGKTALEFQDRYASTQGSGIRLDELSGYGSQMGAAPCLNAVCLPPWQVPFDRHDGLRVLRAVPHWYKDNRHLDPAALAGDYDRIPHPRGPHAAAPGDVPRSRDRPNRG